MVQLAAFPEDRRICVVSAIRAYLTRTPHKISRGTLARWTISILKLAGVSEYNKICFPLYTWCDGVKSKTVENLG